MGPEIGLGPLARAEEARPDPALLEQSAVPDAKASVGGERLGNVGRVGEGDANRHDGDGSGHLGRRPVEGRSGEVRFEGALVLRDLGTHGRHSREVQTTGSRGLRVYRERERGSILILFREEEGREGGEGE